MRASLRSRRAPEFVDIGSVMPFSMSSTFTVWQFLILKFKGFSLYRFCGSRKQVEGVAQPEDPAPGCVPIKRQHRKSSLTRRRAASSKILLLRQAHMLWDQTCLEAEWDPDGVETKEPHAAHYVDHVCT